jgi:hypothetical protein
MTKDRQFGRSLLVACMLLFFGLRDYAVQTHIDPPSFARLSIAKTVAPGPIAAKSSRKNLPAEEKQDNCPLCQQLYGGQYVTPAALPFFLSILTVSTIETVLGVAPHYDAVSHNWLGRGPPRA